MSDDMMRQLTREEIQMIKINKDPFGKVLGAHHVRGPGSIPSTTKNAKTKTKQKERKDPWTHK